MCKPKIVPIDAPHMVMEMLQELERLLLHEFCIEFIKIVSAGVETTQW